MASSAPFRDTQGKTIEDLRNKRGLSKRQLAQEIKCDDNTISAFEEGSRLVPHKRISELREVLAQTSAERKKLDQALTEAYLPKVIHDGNKGFLSIKQKILQASRHGPGGPQQSSRVIFGPLLGAAISLIRCLEILEEKPFSGEQKTWNTSIYDDFEKMLETKGYVDWEYNINAALWSAGYFLNKAQSNLSIALEHLVDDYIEAQIEDDKLKKSLSTINGFILRSNKFLVEIPDTVIKGKLDSLVKKIVQYDSSEKVAGAIRRIYDTHTQDEDIQSNPLGSLEKLFDTLITTEEEQIDFTGVIIARAIVSERRGTGAGRDTDWDYVMEWIETVKATMWLGDLWRLMLAE